MTSAVTPSYAGGLWYSDLVKLRPNLPRDWREQTTPELDVKKSPLYKQNEQCYILTTTDILRQSL